MEMGRELCAAGCCAPTVVFPWCAYFRIWAQSPQQALKYLGGSIYLKAFFLFYLAPNRNGMFWKGTILILGS